MVLIIRGGCSAAHLDGETKEKTEFNVDEMFNAS